MGCVDQLSTHADSLQQQKIVQRISKQLEAGVTAVVYQIVN